MRLSKKCRRSRRASTRARRHRQLTGRLFAETLEKRLLLTTVTSVDPVEGSVSASVSTNISATFDEDIQAASATSDNFIVNSSSRAGPVAVSAAGPTITADPSSNFFPGERVEVTVTSGIQGTATAAVPKTWHFRTEVNSGSGQFVDSGQRLGANIGGRGRFADFDGDGDVDIVERGNVVWMNDGSGVFTDSGQTLGAGAEAVVGDLDGDGDLDVVGQNNVLLNDGSGVFTNTNQNLQGGATVSVGDLDGDGDLDLMQGVNYAADRLWFNDGNGNFSNSGQALSTSSSLGIEFGDFDGDGDLDAFNAINGFPSNQLWVNDGSGVFTNSGQAIGGFASSHDVSIGDVDGDGDLDAVVSNEYSGTGTRVWLNDGNGVFAGTGQQLDTNFRGRTTELGDLDGDGDLDLFVVILWNGSSVFLNDGAGNFTDSGQRLNFVNDIRARRVEGGAIADVDGDGDLDLFEANVGTGGSIIWINQNLQPNVSLSIDPATIAEAAGTATVTATLSAVHTQPVTVDLGLSGTATESDDYTTSGTQIVIATGATSGSVTITAVDDTNDEPDETVIVDIASVAGADKAGGAVTTTILDDDEPAPVPDVTLSVDNGAIAEDAGVATFTATLSVVTTVDVTIGLDFSGSAAASDYTASDTQIVIAAGATTGAVTVTAVQDTEDESDETVVVDIGSVTGGNESGSQQQTTTITDDDEPVVPDVSLAVDNATIPEEAGVATFTATLSEATTLPVTIDVEISGSASAGDDYNASGTQIVIAPGATTGSVTVTAIQDELDEPDETVTVDVSAVANGTESGTQQATTTITDDDEPQGFSVTSVTPTSTGFQVAFTNPIDTADLNLYDTQTAGLGPADVVLTGATSGPVAGSLVVFETMVEFIKSGDALTPDTYNVTLRSAADGFEDTGGLLLDGNGDGTGGDDFNSSFTVPEPAANAVTVGIPDIVRGPGQEVNLPADDTTGIPVTISEGTNVRAIDVRISFDPALLNITGATVGPDAPAGASVIVNSLTPGLAIVVYFATAPLPAGEGNFVNLQATVPEANASENYRRQQVLDVHDVIVSDGNDNESPAIANDALHVSTFFGDVSANGRINAADAAQVARNAALIDGGFAGTPLTDPGVVGDISGNGRLNAADASLVAQFAALITVPQIPAIPGGVVITGLPAVRVPVAEEADSPVSALLPEGNSRANYPAVAVDTVLADYPYDTADDEARTLELEDAIAELLSSDL